MKKLVVALCVVIVLVVAVSIGCMSLKKESPKAMSAPAQIQNPKSLEPQKAPQDKEEESVHHETAVAKGGVLIETAVSISFADEEKGETEGQK